MVNPLPEWLPEARIVRTSRGEVFARVHRHPDPAAPVLLLLHGWTASADSQWVFTYPMLTQRYSVVAVDHHGHGRGLRSRDHFDLAAVAADAAEVVRTLGFERVVLVGFSMGGPISLHLWRDHRDLVAGMVLAATALEFRGRVHERVRWKAGALMRPVMRAWWYPRAVRVALKRLARQEPDLAPMVDWLTAEIMRNDSFAIAQAGTALSRYDARPWAGEVAVPVSAVITTRDRLVRPRKQRALAQTLRAEVVEVRADHLCTLSEPAAFNAALAEALDRVVTRSAVIKTA